MPEHSSEFWSSRWKHTSLEDLRRYLSNYNKQHDPAINFLKAHGVQTVCDAACGYGAYSLMLLSNGFHVDGFDIAPQSVAFTKLLLGEYGYDTSAYQVADVLSPPTTKQYDAVTAISVLEHMETADARRGIYALFQLLLPGGYLVLSFDCLDSEDRQIPHDITDDGSYLYTSGPRTGMILHDYSDEELAALLCAFSVVLSFTQKDGRYFILQKQ